MKPKITVFAIKKNIRWKKNIVGFQFRLHFRAINSTQFHLLLFFNKEIGVFIVLFGGLLSDWFWFWKTLENLWKDGRNNLFDI